MTVYPSQCSCGHIYLEKYQFQSPVDGNIGFCWCGFCRTKLMIPQGAAPNTEGGKCSQDTTDKPDHEAQP